MLLGDLGSVKALHQRCRKRTARFLRSPWLHRCILALIVLDAALVLADLSYLVIHPPCGDHHEPKWLDALIKASLAVVSIFVAELPFQLWALGPQYFNPFGEEPHAAFHIFDAVIVVTTFAVEVALHGQKRDIAGLVILLRLWRLIKLVGNVAVATGDVEEEQIRKLRDSMRELHQTQEVLIATQLEVKELRKRLGMADDAPV